MYYLSSIPTIISYILVIVNMAYEVSIYDQVHTVSKQNMITMET